MPRAARRRAAPAGQTGTIPVLDRSYSAHVYQVKVTNDAGAALSAATSFVADGASKISLGGNPFGYYSYLTDPKYIYHFDLGYEYVFDAADGQGGVCFYDFASGTFFYTSPTFPFPYDFSLNSVVYYYPDPKNAGHYNTDGTRFFYVFSPRQIISK